ncbi:MAG: hypothetical protein P8I27_12545 [Pirellulaceae bacterium]|nr:hypothetical protein [Pirellulaceae bacterium]
MIKLGGLQSSRAGQGRAVATWGYGRDLRFSFSGQLAMGALLLLDHRLSEFTRWS